MRKQTPEQAEKFERHLTSTYDMKIKDIRTLPRLERLWFWMRRLNLGNFTAITLRDTVYMRLDIFNRLSPKGKIELLYHEFEHILQCRKEGFGRFKVRYIFRRQQRIRYEIEAYKNEILVDMFFDGRSNANHYAERLRAYRAREPEVVAARVEFKKFIESYNIFENDPFEQMWGRAMSDERD